MIVINQHIEVIDEINGLDILNKLERIGRTCYKSEDKITSDSSKNFISNILKRGHESVIEHVSISVRVFCDRGVSHEIVRHRIGSYSQESTRYCNYTKEKFDNQLTFVKPHFAKEYDSNFELWKNTMEEIEKNYFQLINNGAKPEEARGILPNSLKTELVMTLNLRSWRNFFKLRCDKSAHPQIREIANLILDEFSKEMPILFDDLKLEK